MAEEPKFDTPDDSDELIIAGKEEKQPDVEMQQIDASKLENVDGDILAKMIEIARRMNGYKCISASHMNVFLDDPKVPLGTTSALARQLFIGYVINRGGNPKEFADLFINTPVVYIQAHEDIPIMAKDGLYDALNANFKVLKSREVAEVVMKDISKFEPFILVKGEGKENFFIIKGNPYHEVTKAEVEVLMKLQNGEPVEGVSEANA